MKYDYTSTGNGARILKIFIIALVLLIFSASLFYYFYNNFAVFQVKDYDSGKVLFNKVIKINDTFTLEFIHSVTMRPVYEVYFIKDKNTLALKELRFDEFGPNLPAGPETFENERTEFIIENGAYTVLFQNRNFDSILLRTGKVIANHTIIFQDNSRLVFSEITPGGSLVEYLVRPITAVFAKGG